MYFYARILRFKIIINHGKYIFPNSFPNNIKRFNKIFLMCSLHIMYKTMNLLPNLMKKLEYWILEESLSLEQEQDRIENQSILKYIIKWNNLPAKYSTWEDISFIQQHQ